MTITISIAVAITIVIVVIIFTVTVGTRGNNLVIITVRLKRVRLSKQSHNFAIIAASSFNRVDLEVDDIVRKSSDASIISQVPLE